VIQRKTSWQQFKAAAGIKDAKERDHAVLSLLALKVKKFSKLSALLSRLASLRYWTKIV